MTWSEIQQTYPDQWVVLGDLDMDDVTLEIHSAVVRGAGRTRREADLAAGGLVDKVEAHLYTGQPRSPRPW